MSGLEIDWTIFGLLLAINYDTLAEGRVLLEVTSSLLATLITVILL